MAKPDGRYRRAAADYTGLPVESPVVGKMASQAASMADWAALEFLRDQAQKLSQASPSQQ